MSQLIVKSRRLRDDAFVGNEFSRPALEEEALLETDANPKPDRFKSIDSLLASVPFFF